MRDSPCGAVTLTQPVSRADSDPRCFDTSVFHSSGSPLYHLVRLSRVMVLYTYIQHDRSGSVYLGLFLGKTVYHLSFALMVF